MMGVVEGRRLEGVTASGKDRVTAACLCSYVRKVCTIYAKKGVTRENYRVQTLVSF